MLMDVGFITISLSLRKTEHFGPASRALVTRCMYRLIRFTHISAASFALYSGFTIVAIHHLRFIGIIPALVIGCLVGFVWSNYRVKSACIEATGVREFTQHKKGSNLTVFEVHGKQVYEAVEANVPPMPLWINTLIILLCEAAGVFIWFGFAALYGWGLW